MPATSFAVERETLDNGLRVVVLPDASTATVAVAVVYDVGFRSEAENRSGFAHLFEHLMFEGSASLEKGQHPRLIQGNGGTFNGFTRPDFTAYFEQVPSNALELALFLEADRMRSPRLTEETLRNQVDVVKEEIRVNVMNRPYGGFPWMQLPAVMYRTYHNAHDGYGSFEHLESATVEDAADFFERYYCPANAVVAIAGGTDPTEALELVREHFGRLPSRPAPPPASLDEPAPEKERHGEHHDKLAPTPALALAYRAPDPLNELDDYLACWAAVELLTDGRASRLHQCLVRSGGLATHVSGWLGALGETIGSRHPTTAEITVHFHEQARRDDLLGALDDEVARLGSHLPDEDLERTTAVMVSSWLSRMDGLSARALSAAVLEQQRGRAELLNEMPERLAALSAERVREVASRCFSPQRRARLDLVPGAAAGPGGAR